MSEDIEKNNEDVKDEEEKDEEVEKEQDDKSGEDEEKEDKGEEEETQDDKDEFDESKIDEDVRDYKPDQSKDDEEDDTDPEDKARIQKIVSKEVGDKLSKVEIELNVSKFINKNPEYAKYEGAMLKYLSHPTYKGIPIHNIAAIVSAKDAQKIGAIKERETQAKVDKTKDTNKSAPAKANGQTDWSKASSDEVIAKRNEVMGIR